MSDKDRTSTRATIDDVAAQAGVSIKTVSRVANQEPNVKPATRELVQAAIAKLGYRPNTAARRLAGNRSYLFALVYEDPSGYENASANFVTNLQGGALKQARAAGYDLLIHPCNYENKGVVDEIKLLFEHSRIDGLLLAPPLAEVKPIVNMLRKMGKPVIRISPGQARAFDAVHTNDREVSAEMTRYLASLGHQQIAFIKGHSHHRAIANRELGYQDGLEQSGLPLRTSLLMDGDNSFESGFACASRLLSRKRRPSAIFAGNDDMAAGVLRAAHELGLQVPGQLSVAGFDDVPLSRQVWPQLTTVYQPVFSLAQKATELLLRQISGEKLTEPTRIDSKLVIRQSTGPAEAKAAT
jgi:LacI family transcriptional regulator